MNTTLSRIYTEHHKNKRGNDFGLYLQERGELFSKIIGTDKTILDIGCRDGALSKFYKEKNTIVGFDIDEVAIKRANLKGIDARLTDLNSEWQIDYENKFDVVVASEIIEHLYNPDKIFNRLYATLKNNGVFIGSVPNAFRISSRIRLASGIKKGTSLEDPTHINHFSLEEIKKLLNNSGFIDIQFYTFPSFRGGLLAKFFPSLFSFMIIFSAKKIINTFVQRFFININNAVCHHIPGKINNTLLTAHNTQGT